MKARKTLQHQALVSEVISQLHQFKPDPKQIKKCVHGTFPSCSCVCVCLCVCVSVCLCICVSVSVSMCCRSGSHVPFFPRRRRIEHLLEREYLERDVEKANVYNYLA